MIFTYYPINNQQFIKRSKKMVIDLLEWRFSHVDFIFNVKAKYDLNEQRWKKEWKESEEVF